MPVRAHDALLGRRIAQERTTCGMTVRDLAARLAWPDARLQAVEHGQHALTVAELCTIAAARDRPPAVFVINDHDTATIVGMLIAHPPLVQHMRLLIDELGADDPDSAPAEATAVGRWGDDAAHAGHY